MPSEQASEMTDRVVVSGVAGRYALALFDLALESKLLDEVAGDLRRLDAMIKDSADLANVVMSPVYGRADQARALDALVKAAGLSDLTRRFLGVVAHNRRLSLLVAMTVEFGRLLAQHKGIVSAEVTSAQKLAAKQTAALQKKLKSMVGRDVDLEASVDESLLGGLVVKISSRMIDSSLKTKLANLQISMKEVG